MSWDRIHHLQVFPYISDTHAHLPQSGALYLIRNPFFSEARILSFLLSFKLVRLKRCCFCSVLTRSFLSGDNGRELFLVGEDHALLCLGREDGLLLVVLEVEFLVLEEIGDAGGKLGKVSRRRERGSVPSNGKVHHLDPEIGDREVVAIPH